jgi:predicted Zn-dependent protease
VRGTPAPEETASARRIEESISAVQAKEFEKQGARQVRADERLGGMPIQQIVNRLSRTERPGLSYRAYIYTDKDPNAAALADGRTYLSSGMITYLASRGGREDELAFVLGHELAHTVAQHLVRRYRTLQQQQVLMSILAAGASAVTSGASTGLQRAGQIAVNAAGLLQQVANSGYSQQDELEADQLGIRYVVRAGFDPRAAIVFLRDFERFDSASPFLRTHPYIQLRREHLERYLAETGGAGAAPPAPPSMPRPSAQGPKSAVCARPSASIPRARSAGGTCSGKLKRWSDKTGGLRFRGMRNA